ncbi:aminotransferase class I/II-fold pyridoxal phosphate-dependent enzyme [Candidatus Vidania fulgoroideorum]
MKNLNGKIIKASSVIFKSYEELIKCEKKKKISYGTQGSKIENKLCKIIKKKNKSKYVVLSPSGLNSIFLIYSTLLKKNEEVIISSGIYEPNKKLIFYMSKKYGIKINLCNNYFKYKDFKKKFCKKNIKIFFTECPSSITYEIPYLNEIVNFCKKNKIISVIDDTYSSGVFFKPLLIGFDISIQALTKFYSGGNDVIMGSIFTNNKKLYKKIKKNKKFLGIYVDQMDCYLLIRSLKTINIRYKIHSKNCKKVIKYLENKSFIEKIIYPFDNKNKNYSFFKNNYKYNAGLFSIIFKKRIMKEKIIKFINSLKIFKIAYSWGGYNSLVMLYKNFFLKKKFFKRFILRFFIGLENVKSIIKDIEKSSKLFY